MPVVGLDHIQLAIPPGAEDRARGFYAGVLELCEVAKPLSLRARGGLWYSAGAFGLHLGVQPGFQPQRKAHPGLVVTGLDEILARANALGLAVSAPDFFLNWRRAYVDDPFGNRLELLEATAEATDPART